MFSKKILFLICCLLFLCLPSFLFAGDLVGDAGLTCNTGPTGVCDTSDYTWYETLDLSSGVISGYWSPSQPGNVSVGFEATATGYGYIKASLSYTVGSVSGSLNLRAEAGYYGVAFFVPFTVPAINKSVGATGVVGSIGSHFGRYDWDVEGTAYVQAVYWKPEAGFPVQGGEFEDYGDANDKDVTGSGSFKVSSKKVCPKCGLTDISYFSEHKYMSCSASITQNGSTVYCSAGSDVWKCQDHTHVFDSSGSGSSGSTPPSGGSTPPSGGGSTPPQSTDNTPNCQDCTSDCSSPCSCTNSGTCGGTVTDNTPNCSGCTSHCSSPCSCSDSGTCNGTVAAPPPSPPEPTLVACERGRGCTVRSSNGRQCYVDPSRSACGHGYWSCNSSAVSWHVTSHPCTRSGCGASYTNCSRGNGTCRAPHPKGGTYQWHGN